MKMKKLLLFLALVPSVCFAQDAAHKAVAEQLNPYVYKILIDDNVNATLMITPQGALLFDTGFKESVGALSETIKQITELPLKGIVNTHYHYDHVGGNAVLGKGLEIAATAFTMGKVEGEGKPNSLIPDNPMVFKGTDEGFQDSHTRGFAFCRPLSVHRHRKRRKCLEISGHTERVDKDAS